jgi:potassium-transporting ATPase KdpC subunit
MRRQVLPAVAMVLVLTVLTGLAYPLVVTGLAQVLMPAAADGSFVAGPDGQLVGSAWLGQPFTGDGYLIPRPSAVDYDGTTSGGSNAGPTNPEFLDEIADRVTAYRQRNSLAPDAAVPVDAVTTSGSGWDPHISVANAELQVPRIAAARGLDEAQIRRIVAAHTDGRALGFLGEPAVDVLEANVALDQLSAGS